MSPVASPDTHQYLFHFTGRPDASKASGSSAEIRLAGILHEGKIRAFTTPQAGAPVVCFSEFSIANLRAAFGDGITGRSPYTPWGLVLVKDKLVSLNAKPVLHLSAKELRLIEKIPELRLRSVRYDPVPTGSVIWSEWDHEREWRWIPGAEETGSLPGLKLTRDLVAGVITGIQGWQPTPPLPAQGGLESMHGVPRYFWNGSQLVADGYVQTGYRFAMPLFPGPIDWSGDTPRPALQ